MTLDTDTKVQVINNLTSSSTTAALSANQGRILNDKISATPTRTILYNSIVKFSGSNPSYISFPVSTAIQYPVLTFYVDSFIFSGGNSDHEDLTNLSFSGFDIYVSQKAYSSIRGAIVFNATLTEIRYANTSIYLSYTVSEADNNARINIYTSEDIGGVVPNTIIVTSVRISSVRCRIYGEKAPV